MKTNFLNRTTIAAVLSLSTVGLLAGADSASAAALTGKFQLDGGITIPTGNSLISLSADSLIFSPQPTTPVAIAAQTGSFTSFNTANIGSIISFSSLNAENPFLDFGTTSGLVGLTSGDSASITDKINIFTLQSADYKLEDTITNNKVTGTSVSVAIQGFFTSATGETSKGEGNLTFQIAGDGASVVQAKLDAGNSINNLAFSGAVMSTTSVPEPTTNLGLLVLGLMGAATVVKRKKIA